MPFYIYGKQCQHLKKEMQTSEAGKNGRKFTAFLKLGPFLYFVMLVEEKEGKGLFSIAESNIPYFSL